MKTYKNWALRVKAKFISETKKRLDIERENYLYYRRKLKEAKEEFANTEIGWVTEHDEDGHSTSFWYDSGKSEKEEIRRCRRAVNKQEEILKKLKLDLKRFQKEFNKKQEQIRKGAV